MLPPKLKYVLVPVKIIFSAYRLCVAQRFFHLLAVPPKSFEFVVAGHTCLLVIVIVSPAALSRIEESSISIPFALHLLNVLNLSLYTSDAADE